MATTFTVSFNTTPSPLASGSPGRIQCVVSHDMEGTQAVMIRVAIPYDDGEGSQRCSLIGASDIPTLTCAAGEFLRDGDNNGSRIWYSDGLFDLTKAMKLTLDLTDLTVPAHVGTASMTVSLNPGSDWEDFTLLIPIVAPVPKLEYFTVSDDYLDGPKEVVIKGAASSVSALTLRMNGERINTYLAADGTDKIEFTHTKRVEASSVFGLEVAQPEGHLGGGGFPAVANVYVQNKSTWQPLNLPGGVAYATNFFQLSGKLYGTFIDSNETASLWCSQTGVSGWLPADGDFPQMMSHSPGVVWRDKIWLIGGSGVHADRHANRMWCYGRQDSNRLEWKEISPSNELSPWPEKRMGHACTVFKDRIWLIGGLGEDNFARNDVWSYDDHEQWKRQAQSAASPRCMFSAAATPAWGSNAPVDQPRLWIYGGVIHPFNFDGLGDLWSMSEDGKWTDFSHLLPDYPSCARPVGATLIWDEMLNGLRLAGIFRNDKTTSYASRVLMGVYPLVWAVANYEWHLYFDRGDSFLLSAAALGKRMFFVAQHHTHGGKKYPKVHILTQ